MGNGRRYQGRAKNSFRAETGRFAEKASGQRLLSTEKRIDAKQFHLGHSGTRLCDHSSTGHIGEGSDFESVEDERQGGA